MKKIIAFLAVCSLLLISCNKEVKLLPQSAIDKNTRQTIRRKNDSLIQALQTSNLKIYKALGTDEFNKHLQARTLNIAMMFRRLYLDGTYKVYDEHIVTNKKGQSELKFDNPELGYRYLSISKGEQTYVSMLKMLVTDQDYLLICCYAKQTNGDWKINKLEITPIGRYGLTPKEMYAEAVKAKEKNEFLDAYYNARMTLDWIKSFDDLKSPLQFNLKEEAEELKDEMADKLNNKYKFPLTINQLPGKPVITDISKKLTTKGIFPCVVYESSLGNDEAAMELEYEQLREIAPKLFPDMDFKKQYAVYKVTYHQTGDYGPTVNDKEFFYKRY